ncbi:sensor histidine kinase [Chryseobacterium sp. MMS23-Vi53]|uniref:sensor histidine kinase n=1 Tax=Chryseobacterium sp. MMS23-Vi53 TaxID=3386644 RepID=UPI0039EA2CE3
MESISHDITTPIRFIVTISQELDKEKDSELQKQYFNEIYKTSEQLYKFTSDLKEYTKLFKEDSIFEEEVYPLYDLLENKKVLYEQIALKNKVMIINNCDRYISTIINKNILSAIFHNLLDNAAKYTENGTIEIISTTIGNYIEIGIFDSGKGMSEEQILYYNEVFNNMDAHQFVFKDYGFGLHMIIQLVKKIDAKISFHKNTPSGTIVKVLIKENPRA